MQIRAIGNEPGTRRLTVLVLGFGPFAGVNENPSARLALEVDGALIPGARVIGEVMRVSWSDAPALTRRRAAELGADLVLGIGVARGRALPLMERYGRRIVSPELPDVDGERRAVLDEEGPDELVSDLAAPWAEALGFGESDDAGRYVCNAWLWHALQDDLPAAFLHVPMEGVPAEQLLNGIARMVASFRHSS